MVQVVFQKQNPVGSFVPMEASAPVAGSPTVSALRCQELRCTSVCTCSGSAKPRVSHRPHGMGPLWAAQTGGMGKGECVGGR